MSTALAKKDPRDIQIGGLLVTKTGIRKLGGFSETDWKNCAGLLDQFNQGVNWCVGDLMLLGEPVFGEEKVQQWVDDMVPSMGPEQKLKCQRVANSFPHNRRIPSLSWSKHREAAWVEKLEDRVRLLEKAEKEGWTESDVRRAAKGDEAKPWQDAFSRTLERVGQQLQDHNCFGPRASEAIDTLRDVARAAA